MTGANRLKILLWIVLAAAGTWLAYQHSEARALQREIDSIHSHRVTATPPAPAPAPPTVPAKPETSRRAASTFDPQALMDEIKARVDPLLSAGLGETHPDVLAAITAALSGLEPSELAAVIAGDPDFHFATRHDQAAVTGDERIDAIVRWRALLKLAAEDPSAALRLTERADLRETSGDLINLITSSLQRWSESDATAAVRWGKAQAERLPLGINHAHMALEALARTDMEGAWALARREGIEPTQVMSYLSRAIATHEDCDIFMSEVSALQAGAPDGFVGGANQFHETLAVKLAQSLGFEEARQFLNRWSSTLEWRDAPALDVVKTTFSRTPDARSAAAANWYVEFTPEARRASAVPNLVSAWADEDFSQPAEWLKRHADEPWHDAALAALCRKIAPFDPEAAAQWAASIENAELRASILPGGRR